MAKLENPYISYVERSYQQIKSAVLSKLTNTVPEMTDHSETNVWIVLLSVYSGMAEMMGFYIDNAARESFITTARRYDSMVKLTRLIDYRIKARIASSADLTFTALDGAGDPIAIDSPAFLGIPANTLIKTPNGTDFLTTIDVQITDGNSFVSVPAEQKTLISGNDFGLTTGGPDQTYEIGTEYQDGSLNLTVGAVPYQRLNTLGRSGPTDTVYIIDITEDKIAIIRFGDGVNGIAPPGGQTLLGDFYETEGVDGNVENLAISNLISVLTLPAGVSSVIVSNTLNSTGGVDYQSIDEIRRSAPISIRTLDRAVTFRDYIDVASIAPGIDKACVFFDCGKTIEIYVSPIGGGIASNALLQTVADYMDDKKMITTFINMHPVGQTELVITVEVTAKFRVVGTLCGDEVRTALLEDWDYESSDINKQVRKSDIISLVDNLPTVDFLNLTILTTRPYAEPTGTNTLQLNWVRVTLTGSTAIVRWRLNFGGPTFRLFKDDILIESGILENVVYTDPDNIIQFTILPDAYIINMNWKFTTYAHTDNIPLDDFTVPILNTVNLNVLVTEQLFDNPNC